MRTFAIGAIIALLLTGGAAYLYSRSGVTMAERSSPSGSVRVDDEVSRSAKGAGYGVPHEKAGDESGEQETARR